MTSHNFDSNGYIMLDNGANYAS